MENKMTETRLFDILSSNLAKHPDQKIALSKKENGQWRNYSIQEYSDLVEYLSYAFIELGIQPDDKIAIIGSNSPQWNMLDMAIMQVGAISVPIYPTITQEDYLFILNNCEAKLVISEGLSMLKKIEAIKDQLTSLKYLYTFNPISENPTFANLVSLGEQHPHSEELIKRKKAVDPMQCATIIYTSGTTGTPKGVMLSHNNILRQIDNLRHTPDPRSCRALSFLPLCHAYERLIVYLYQYLNMSVYYAESMATIGDDMRYVHPTMMTAVPRLLEKMHAKIVQSGNKQKGIKRVIFRWAVRLAERYKIDEDQRSWWYNQRIKIADKLVYSKIRKTLGAEEFDIVVSGAASIQPKLASFFSAIKMPVYEGYGLTETSPVIAVSNNNKYGRECGTVGQVLPGIEVKIADNGEICCRGYNVMMGYYKNEELTKQVIDSEGWFHTGDLGLINEHGQMIITGRLKNLFKTSLGKYINPQVIEDTFTESGFFENVVVFGENRKYAAALIVPDFNFLKQWCAKHSIKFTTPAEIINLKEVKDRIAKEVQKMNNNFGDTEKIKKFRLVSDEWSVNNGILTPTLKVKRKVVQQRYADLIETMFVDNAA